MICRRFGAKPLLTRQQVPDMPPAVIDATSVFNPGAMRRDGVEFLLLRVQTRGRRTVLLPARSEDGTDFTPASRPTEFVGLADLETVGVAIHHVYDPRITVLEGRVLVVTAIGTDGGCRLAVWRATGDPGLGFGGLDRLELIGLAGDTDTRNGVLFPARIGGRYAMLHRPNRPAETRAAADDPDSGSVIVLSFSDDLLNWDPGRPVLAGRPHFWDELIGSGPPPLPTPDGWLHLYHGIATHFQSVNIYQAGAVLLDRDDPSRVLGRTRDNVLEPRTAWEMVGQVPNVVFPSGWTADKMDPDGTVPRDAGIRIYYGAADTVVGRADTTVDELVAACEPPPA